MKKLIFLLSVFMTLLLSSCKKENSFEGPEMVEIPGLEISMLNTEVTQALYESVMGENPSSNKGDNNPVEMVSWYDAVYFCNKLSEKYGYTPVYSVNGNTNPDKWGYVQHKGKWLADITQNDNANGFRLPTKAEWEYTAMGGQDYVYSGSNKLDEVGWYRENSGDKTHPVAQKKANGYGLYDMSGNVWEWCWDSAGNDHYIRSGSNNVYMALRYYCGGCYNDYNRTCGLDHYASYFAYHEDDNLGFRIVRSVFE